MEMLQLLGSPLFSLGLSLAALMLAIPFLGSRSKGSAPSACAPKKLLEEQDCAALPVGLAETDRFSFHGSWTARVRGAVSELVRLPLLLDVQARVICVDGEKDRSCIKCADDVMWVKPLQKEVSEM